MSGAPGRGRGRGRGAPKPPREPDTAALDRLNQEKESITKKSDDPTLPTSEQFSDPPGEQPKSAITTTGEGKRPPIAEEIKEAMRNGVKVGQPPVTNPLHVTLPWKPDPEATPFIPLRESTTSSSLSPSPMFTKYSNPPASVPTQSKSNALELDPESKEFVPSRSEAPHTGGHPTTSLVPNETSYPSYENGYIEEGDDEEGVYLDSKDIVKGFERAVPTGSKDNSEPTLMAGADMLLRVYNYPGSFDESGQKFKEMLQHLSPSENTLINLAEMLIHWGLFVVDLRYSACRVCHLISEMEGFKRLLMTRLQGWHNKVNRETFTNDEERYNFVNFSGFLAEIYSKIMDHTGKPYLFMGKIIFRYVQKLVDIKMDFFIHEACNILKLTGNHLVQREDYEKNITEILKAMNELTMSDQSLSKTCISLILQVSELAGSRWSCGASPPSPPSVDVTGRQSTEVTSRLNTNAAPFVPSGFVPSETFYDPQVIQQPVTSADDWDEFVGEDQIIEYPEAEGFEGFDANDGIFSDVIENDDYDDDGLDLEIELEMEAFIDEIEEHLMLQDFDPELQQQPKPQSGK